MNILDYQRYHFVGIQGVGMTALALILKDLQKQVTGSDLKENYLTKDFLFKRGIKVANNFSSENVDKAEILIYSAAHKGKDNSEVQFALKQNLKVFSLAEFLGELSNSKKTISICGCHGKSTTSALVSFLGNQLELQMSYYVGAPGFNEYPPGKWNDQGKYFVVESDEYVADLKYDRVAKFLHLSPHYIICTNIDFDHPDVYRNIEELEAVYLKFFKKVKGKGFLLVNGDDERLLKIAKESAVTFYTYGKEKRNDYQIIAVNEKDKNSLIRFEIKSREKSLGIFETKLLGDHNIYNLTAGIAFYSILCFDLSKITSKIAQFNGVKRRLELIYQKQERLIYDDYAHHPKEIEASLIALKKSYPEHQLILFFQPHTFSRTAALADDFVKSLTKADQTFLLPVFASARETQNQQQVTSVTLMQKAKDQDYSNIVCLNSEKEIEKRVSDAKHEFAKIVFITMGAGDVYQNINQIKTILNK